MTTAKKENGTTMTPRRLLLGRCAIGLATLGLTGALLLTPATVKAQSVSGEAYAALVNSGGSVQKFAAAVLPGTGGMTEGELESLNVASALDSRWLTSVATGTVEDGVTSQIWSSAENVTILGGLITADIVTAISSSYSTGFTVASDAEGSGFVRLVVNGIPQAVDPAPNTRIDIPGVGYVLLNEQVRTGDGVNTSGLAVNMIRVVVVDATTGSKTGEIVVGSASSGVSQ